MMMMKIKMMRDHEWDEEPVSTLHSFNKAMRCQTFPRKYGVYVRDYHHWFNNEHSCLCQQLLHEVDYNFGLRFWVSVRLWCFCIARLWCFCSPRLPMNITDLYTSKLSSERCNVMAYNSPKNCYSGTSEERTRLEPAILSFVEKLSAHFKKEEKQ